MIIYLKPVVLRNDILIKPESMTQDFGFTGVLEKQARSTWMCKCRLKQDAVSDHSGLRNCFSGASVESKDKSDSGFIKFSFLSSFLVFLCLQNAHAVQKPNLSGRITREVSQQIHENTSNQILTKAKDNKLIQSKEKIKLIQTLLNKQGFNAGVADGINGKKTQTAIKQFQQANQLTADGLVTEQLLVKLQSLAQQEH